MLDLLVAERLPRLRDLQSAYYDVSMGCRHCHRLVTLSVDELRVQFGRNGSLEHIAQNLRCMGCGRKGLGAAVRLK